MTIVKLQHVSGQRNETRLGMSNRDIVSARDTRMIFRDDNGDYYFLYRYRILNPNEIGLNNIDVYWGEVDKSEPNDLVHIKVQSKLGDTNIIYAPDHTFEFDGVHLLYRGQRVVEMNGYSVTVRDGGDIFLFAANVYGIIPKIIEDDVVEFPEYDEPKIVIAGYDQYSPTKVERHFEYRGVEARKVWEYMIYAKKAKELHLSVPGSPIIVTTIDGQPIKPKKLARKHKIRTLNA